LSREQGLSKLALHAGGVLWQGHERGHLQNQQRNLSLLRGADDGLDGKKQLFNMLEDHVCTDCTRTFFFSFVSVPTQKLDLYRCGTMQQAFAGGRHRAYESPRRNIQKFTEPNLAKVGVEGSNPFAPSNLYQLFQ
jgi:hypothetical protein